MSSTIVINDTLPYTQSIATNGQTVFDTQWTVDATTDVVVYDRDPNDDPDDVTQVVSPNDYIVTQVGVEEYVRVTFLVGRTLNHIITITRQTPFDRDSLYSNTNFTPTMLNGDFGRLTLMVQQLQLLSEKITPHYNYDATIQDVIDTILPILPASHTWRKNSTDTAMEIYELPDGGIAPADMTYLTLTDESADLPNSFALSSLGAGILVNKPSTNTVLSRLLQGTNNRIEVSTQDGVSGNFIIDIVDNPIIPGTEGMGIPTGTTAERPGVPNGTNLRFNTDLGQMEYYDGGAWVQLEDSTDITTLLALLASHLAGEGASLIGLENQGTVNNKTVQDLAEMSFVTVNDDTGTLLNSQQLSALALLLAGGTMAGNISMDNTYKITNALDPVDPQDYATKAYVDGGGGGPPFLPLAGGTMAGSINMDSNTITNLPTPLTNSEPATKGYVDSIVYAVHPPALYATTGNLAGYTYNNGTAGVGATLTAGSNGAFTVDGASPTVNTRILVPNQTSQLENGIYVLTQVGDGSNPAILTRAADYDEASDMQPGDIVFVVGGATLAGHQFMMTQLSPITVGVTAITWLDITDGQTIATGFESSLLLMGG